MISTASGSRNITSIILIVTDGGLSDPNLAQSQVTLTQFLSTFSSATLNFVQARTAQARGSTIFAIGVGGYIIQQVIYILHVNITQTYFVISLTYLPSRCV